METMIKKTMLKQYVKEQGLSCASDLLEPLNEKLCTLVKEGIERAKANKRNTLFARDL